MDGKYQIGFWIVKYEIDHRETKQRRNPQKIIIDEKEHSSCQNKNPVTKSFTENNSFNSTGPQNFYPSSRTLILPFKAQVYRLHHTLHILCFL